MADGTGAHKETFTDPHHVWSTLKSRYPETLTLALLFRWTKIESRVCSSSPEEPPWAKPKLPIIPKVAGADCLELPRLWCFKNSQLFTQVGLLNLLNLKCKENNFSSDEFWRENAIPGGPKQMLGKKNWWREAENNPLRKQCHWTRC